MSHNVTYWFYFYGWDCCGNVIWVVAIARPYFNSIYQGILSQYPVPEVLLPFALSRSLSLGKCPHLSICNIRTENRFTVELVLCILGSILQPILLEGNLLVMIEHLRYRVCVPFGQLNFQGLALVNWLRTLRLRWDLSLHHSLHSRIPLSSRLHGFRRIAIIQQPAPWTVTTQLNHSDTDIAAEPLLEFCART
jgi:hypothetical protein